MGSFRARTLRGLPDVTELTLYRQDRARTTALAAELEAMVAGSIEETIGAGPDALVIATSTPDHPALVEAGVEAGLPVFCEKPISMDLETTDRLARLVAASGVPVQVGFQRLFDAGFRRARELVRSGARGRVYLVRVLAHDYEPPPGSFIAVSGGMFKDMLIHEFHLIPWVAEQPIVEVYAEGSVLVDEYFDRQDDVDTATAVLRLSEGAMAVVTASRYYPLGYDARMELHGSGDSVAIGWDERAPLRPLESDKAAGGPYHTSFSSASAMPTARS